MRKLVWSKTFIRAFKRVIKKHPNLREDIEDALRLLVQDPFAPQLETHKLKGRLSGSWACSAGYDLRIVFDFVKNEKQKEDDIFLIEIGTHDEVY
ncbi:MAG: type II toxin-antitoxin system mRNA interferase toxin, RelE/StbE family [Nitrospirota bacterium]|jgi:addiction module RelE/StbE family toxin